MKENFCLIRTMIVFCTVTFLLPCSIIAESLTSIDIAQKAYDRDDGKSSLFKTEMTLIDKTGSKRVRTFISQRKKFDGLNKSIMRFLSPNDIEGTGFLTLEHKDTDDTQYLFLPELGRSRRIVAGQKDQPFVGSDFTFEDMMRRKVEKDTHTLLGEETWNGFDCYRLESVPKEKKSSQYTKTRTWIEKKSYVIVKAEFYNKSGKIIKKLEVSRLEQINSLWTSMDILMKDLVRKHSSRLRILEAEYNKDVDDQIFTVRHLEDY